MIPLLLKVKNLRVKIGEKDILRGASVAVNAGEIHFLMGPNGSGKTTLAHALAGHPAVALTGGMMMFRGRDLRGLPPEERAKAGLYLGFQYPAEVPGVGVSSFLRSAIAARGGIPPRAEEFRAALEHAASRVKMDTALLDRNLNEGFSGGEKKRSEILQLYILQPTLAILDEFDSGLDVDGVRAVCESLNQWMGPERALLVITHTGRAGEYLKPDRVHIMDRGVIVKSGDAALIREVEERGFESLA